MGVAALTNYIFFAYQYICSEKPVFVSTFLPFCPVSFWSQSVYSRWRVETRFYLFHGTRSLREFLGRYAPVTAADVLTLNTIDIHWSMSRSLDPEYIYIRTKKPVFSKVPRDI